jgi:hypothetical protein
MVGSLNRMMQKQLCYTHLKHLTKKEKQMSLLTRMPKHGDCFDRGSADAYYGRPFEPHWYPDGTGKGIRIVQSDMTAQEIAEYTEGYENETDRKDWG